MLFLTYEPYSDDEIHSNEISTENTDNVRLECFICYDTYDKEHLLISLKEIEILDYKKGCSCDGWIHIHCLETWYHHHHRCPICRKHIERNHFQMDHSSHLRIRIYLSFVSFALYQMYKLFRWFCFLYSIYFFCSLFLYLLLQK